jgi:hypothetical protein
MNSLFKDDRYTPEACEILTEFARAAEKTIRKYKDQGYSVRELSHILQGAVTDAECSVLLDLDEGSKESVEKDGH